ADAARADRPRGRAEMESFQRPEAAPARAGRLAGGDIRSQSFFARESREWSRIPSPIPVECRAGACRRAVAPHASEYRGHLRRNPLLASAMKLAAAEFFRPRVLSEAASRECPTRTGFQILFE